MKYTAIKPSAPGAALVLVLAALGMGFGRSAADSESALRVALIGFTGASRVSTLPAPMAADPLLTALAAGLARRTEVALVDRALIGPAVAGVGYDGSINMSRDEARGLGAAIGCDFFVIGKHDVFTISETKGEEHQEAIVGVMIVDARSGGLAVFDFISEKGATQDAALRALSSVLATRAPKYIEEIAAYRAGRFSRRQVIAADDHVEDIPNADSAAAAGFKPPEFLTRSKPVYTLQADRADVTATVEALGVFRADGTVGEVVITRWAGFGLDAAAEQAIRQLKFKPAERDGRPVSVRAAIRYNFRRISDTSHR